MMINNNYNLRIITQSLVLLAAVLVLQTKLVSAADRHPHTVVVTFQPDVDGVEVSSSDEGDLPNRCNKYVTNLGRAVDMALIQVNVIGDKQAKAWRTYHRLNGRLTELENHLDDLNEQLNHATQQGSSSSSDSDDEERRQLAGCDGDCYAWCQWMPWYCFCCPCCGNVARRRLGGERTRNLRPRQLMVPDDDQDNIEDLEIRAEAEVSKQLGRWNKEIDCIKRSWDSTNHRWDYTDSVNVEIIPVTDDNLNDTDTDATTTATTNAVAGDVGAADSSSSDKNNDSAEANDLEQRRQHKLEKKQRKKAVIKDMRQKIAATQEAIRIAQEQLERALAQEQEAEVEVEAAGVGVHIEDLKDPENNEIVQCTNEIWERKKGKKNRDWEWTILDRHHHHGKWWEHHDDEDEGTTTNQQWEEEEEDWQQEHHQHHESSSSSDNKWNSWSGRTTSERRVGGGRNRRWNNKHWH